MLRVYFQLLILLKIYEYILTHYEIHCFNVTLLCCLMLLMLFNVTYVVYRV